MKNAKRKHKKVRKTVNQEKMKSKIIKEARCEYLKKTHLLYNTYKKVLLFLRTQGWTTILYILTMLVLLKKFPKRNSNEWHIPNTDKADNKSKQLPKKYSVLLN